ncbi:MAG: tRNA uridine-5-carboxymethylaminomethyl(34) synthesis GTPase MnmE [Alphaproteobacteria bacterium]|nr:MAG: tRNA uridine-5-carboxymethylaminomethyl(34) synthesis GTPase MnmE [Alphaproteobacteria bacterium]
MAPAGGRDRTADTIFAPASGHGVAAIAVIRLSGPRSWQAVRALTAGPLPPPRQLALRRMVGAGGRLLDEGMVVLFPEGGSFTGEAAAELHLHGSLAVVKAVMERLGSLPGLRLARPGEFTRRALEAGRLDLTRAEGLGDLLQAETEAQHDQAMRAMRGELSGAVAGLRGDLIALMAQIEARIDFADEELPELDLADLYRRLGDVRASLARMLEGSAAAERIRDGFEIAIVGRPNAGKSTLLNQIAGRDVAITSTEAGTTRDILELRADIGGLAVTFLDMAGLRPAEGEIEAEGVRRAQVRAQAADLRIFLLDAGETVGDLRILPGKDDIMVQAKADLAQDVPTGRDLAVSGLTGQGVDDLLRLVGTRLSGRTAGASLLTRAYQQRAVEEALRHLAAAEGAPARPDRHPELFAEHVRAATRALDVLVGRVDVEQVLDDVFSRFCLGK